MELKPEPGPQQAYIHIGIEFDHGCHAVLLLAPCKAPRNILRLITFYKMLNPIIKVPNVPNKCLLSLP